MESFLCAVLSGRMRMTGFNVFLCLIERHCSIAFPADSFYSLVADDSIYFLLKNDLNGQAVHRRTSACRVIAGYQTARLFLDFAVFLSILKMLFIFHPDQTDGGNHAVHAF